MHTTPTRTLGGRILGATSKEKDWCCTGVRGEKGSEENDGEARSVFIFVLVYVSMKQCVSVSVYM
eukprot:8270-Eustigmatos_ZCMA.PRE.1